MNKPTHKLTYGIEIEGLFSTTLVDKLYHLKGVDIDAKTDPSVNVHNVPDDVSIAKTEECEDNCYHDEDDCDGGCYNGYENVSEITIGVFKTLSPMLKTMKMFSSKNHFYNDSCGVHVHVGVQDKNDIVWSIINDRLFIQKLQVFARTSEKMCEDIRSRTVNGGAYFCRLYSENSIDSFLTEFIRQDKYRFVRNHPQGTLEFRFFSACKHMTENVKAFFEYMFDEIAKTKTTRKKATFTVNESEITSPIVVEYGKVEEKTRIEIEL